MLKRFTGTVVLFAVLVIAGCWGEEEPTPTPTPLATFTPTAAPATAPTASPPDAAAAVPEETAAPAPEAEQETPAAGPGTPAAMAPDSPLAAPDSPLPAPAEPPGEATGEAAGEAAEPIQPPVAGVWQLQTIRAASSAGETPAPPGYRLVFSPTGVVRVTADCRTGRGQFIRSPEGALTLEIAYVDIRCAPDSLADPFARALGEVTSYRSDGDRLVLIYGAQGGEMGLTRVSPMTAFGAPFLSWSSLKNSTFLVPNTPAGDGQAPLLDGEFRADLPPSLTTPITTDVTTAAGAETDFVVSLATMHTYGELDPPTPEPTPLVPLPADATPTPTPEPEIAIDSVVVLVVNDGIAAPQSYLAPVLNGGGLALPLTLEPLGENVYVRDLRWDGEQLTIDFDLGSEGKRRSYTFDADHFVQVSEEDLPPQAPRGRLDLPTQDVVLTAAPAAAGTGTAEAGAAGTADASLTGAIAAGVVHPYRLAAQAGQQLTVTLQSPFDNVWLSLYGADDHTVLRSIRSETSSWAGVVPSTQEYIAGAVAAGSASPYTLTIQLAGARQDTPQAPTVTGTVTEAADNNAVHLVIDGAPSAALLEVLARNDAQADFFVTAAQAAVAAENLAEASAAGHGIGIVAGPIAALTSSGRDTLFTQISGVRRDIGEAIDSAAGESTGETGEVIGSRVVKCLRPPAAATDGYTRAAAAELGFDILLWDIDAGTTPIDALAQQVFPGAVVRFAAAGAADNGDAAVMAALEGLLPLLAEQGYRVQAACR